MASSESEFSLLEENQFEEKQLVQKSHDFSEITCHEIKTPSYNIANGSSRVFDESVTINEAMTLTTALRVKHHISDSLHIDIHKIVNKILGREILPESEYLLKKSIFNDNESIVYLYCTDCSTLLGNLFDKIDSIYCNKCKKVVKKNISVPNYFIYSNIAKSFSQLLEEQDLFDNLKIECPNNTNDEYICDVGDGTLHKELRELSKRVDICTFEYFIDGAPVFKSSENSVWYIKVILNCIKENVRFKRVLTVAVGMGNTNFNMQTFLIPLTKWAEYLFNSGVTYTNKHGIKITKYFLPFCLKCDKGAVHKVCLCSAFNGEYGCNFCLHPNKTVDGRIYNKYVVLNEKADRRSNEMWLNDAELASSALRIRGIRGKTILYRMPFVKFPQHISIEPIHCLYLGVSKYMVDHLWFKPSGYEFYIGRPLAIKRIDALLINLRLPEYADSRLPKSLSNRSNWKASQWKYWCLYISIPILLTTIIDKKYINHWGHFVKATYILSKEKIQKDKVIEADKLYFDFVYGIQMLYGSEFMTSNIHSLEHISETVIRLGPLWAHAASCDESSIGKSKLDVTGTRGVLEQIINRSLLKESFFSKVNHMCEAESVKYICYNLTQGRVNYNSAEFSVYGTVKYEEASGLTSYPRAIRNGIVLRSEARQIGTRNFDCSINLQDGRFAIIKKILCHNNAVFFELEILNSIQVVLEGFSDSTINLNDVTMDHLYTCERSGKFEIVHNTNIGDKCLYFTIENITYIASRPNSFERQ